MIHSSFHGFVTNLSMPNAIPVMELEFQQFYFLQLSQNMLMSKLKHPAQ